jgi:hypothetical protein
MEYTTPRKPQDDMVYANTRNTGWPTNGKSDMSEHRGLMPAILPTVATVCLSTHQECTQEYIDTTRSFRIRCVCSCHALGRLKIDQTGEPLRTMGIVK